MESGTTGTAPSDTQRGLFSRVDRWLLAELRWTVRRVALCMALAIPIAALSLWLRWPGWADVAAGLLIGVALLYGDPSLRRELKRLRGGPGA